MRALLLALLALAVGGAVAGAVAGTRSSAAPAPDALQAQLPCCIPLGRSMHIRYANLSAAPGGDTFEFALVGALPETSWFAFGPADPRAKSRFMGSADCAAGGLSDKGGAPWVSDLYLSSYAPCDVSSSPAVGVCPDASINANPKTGAPLASTPAAVKALDSVTLVGGGRLNGVTTVRARRKLAAADALDHAIDPNAPLNFIWAHGRLSPGGPSDPALRLQQHGATPDSYGVLLGVKLASCPVTCPKLVTAPAEPVPAAAPALPPAAPPPPAAAAVRSAQLKGGGGRVTWALKAGPGGAPGAQVSFEAAKQSQWAAVAVGSGMIGARAYVAWKDGGALKSGVFDLKSYSSSGVKQLPADAAHGLVSSMTKGADGRIKLGAWVPVAAGTKEIPLIWALGEGFSLPLKSAAQHFAQADAPTMLDVRPPPPPPPAVKRPLIPGCALTQQFELARLGDGWCDALDPYNSAACGFDGGDCCNLKSSIYDCRDPKSPNFGKTSPRGLRFPAPRNPRYSAGLGRVLSTQDLVTSYNNFYEFSTDKNVVAYVTPESQVVMELANPKFPGWAITIDGMVAKPQKIELRDLLKLVHTEERVYRHRCVEAWSIVVPWVGFPLRKLLSLVQPLPGARYIRFETDKGPYMPNARGASLSPGTPNWPYVEGLAIQEAWNDLAFLSVGLFNSSLPVQSGAPIRLNVPWKYGFKSVKSIRKISFVADRPLNYWHEFAPDEYGFWANINPNVPHPRWSQASEQELVDSPAARGFIRTTIFNNYTSEVAYMYGPERSYYF